MLLRRALFVGCECAGVRAGRCDACIPAPSNGVKAMSTMIFRGAFVVVEALAVAAFWYAWIFVGLAAA